jgi:hypothetical protein
LISPAQGAHLVSALGDLDGYRHDDLTSAPLQFTAPPRYANTESIDDAGRKPSWLVRSGYLRYPFGPAIRAAYSEDGGNHWQPFASEPPEGQGAGNIAIAADAGAVLWFPAEAKTAYLTRDFGKHWIAAEGLSAHAHVLSDRLDPQRFYAYDAGSGTIFVSRDGGAHFHAIGGVLDYHAKPRDHLEVHAAPDAAGVLYVGSDGAGLLRANDDGVLLARADELSDVESFGFGCPEPGKHVPTLFAAGVHDGVQGFYRSSDGGVHWVRIDDDDHRFGKIRHVTGDPRIFGRVYFSTSGRGVIYGDPVGPEQP